MGHGLISQEIIKQVKERTDIAEVVSGYVTLTKTGQNLKGLCPFHNEKTPSFTVSSSRQMFHCFGCGEGGDVFTFLMKRENLGFTESVQELGRRAGVPIQVSVGGQVSEDEVRRERIRAINEKAAAWFRRNLFDAQVGKDAQQYLTSRGISLETAQTFGMGLALPSWDGLLRSMGREGFTPVELASAGLAVQKDQGGSQRRDEASYYDRFRGRIMFPIHDLRRRVTAFGGRVLGEGMPKYLNSPDTPVFRKGSALYGLERAREASAQARSLVIVEGYFDAVAFHQAGITNVVATLGTALTADHVQLLRRFASKVVLLFDPDPAGVRASVRTLDLFQGSGVAVRVVSVPEGEDPDTFIRKEGAEAFFHLQATAPSLVEFAVNQSLKEAGSDVIEERIRSVDDILRILQKTENRIEKEECLRLVAERLGINQQVLIQRYPELVHMRTDRHLNRVQAGRSSSDSAGQMAGMKESPWERDLTRFLLQGQLSADQIQALAGVDFSVPAFRQIVESALRNLTSEGGVRLEAVLEEMAKSPDWVSLATELCLSEVHYDDQQAYIRGCFGALERARHQLRLSQLIAQLRDAEREGQSEEALRLNTEVNEMRQKKSLSRL